MQAYAKAGVCIKVEEVFEALQVSGCNPDVYAYNALLEAYRYLRFCRPQISTTLIQVVLNFCFLCGFDGPSECNVPL
jgi:pentatricopeptide repeat protein